MQFEKDGFLITDDAQRIDLDAVCRLLADTYWASARSRQTIAKSIANSIPIGLYHGDRQIGFARIVTDRATFAWIADVIVDAAYRGQGLGTWLAECVLSHPEIAGMRHLLRTRDAHSLYERFGFRRNECMTRDHSGHDWERP